MDPLSESLLDSVETEVENPWVEYWFGHVIPSCRWHVQSSNKCCVACVHKTQEKDMIFFMKNTAACCRLKAVDRSVCAVGNSSSNC